MWKKIRNGLAPFQRKGLSWKDLEEREQKRRTGGMKEGRRWGQKNLPLG